jgi:hypothetical protein
MIGGVVAGGAVSGGKDSTTANGNATESIPLAQIDTTISDIDTAHVEPVSHHGSTFDDTFSTKIKSELAPHSTAALEPQPQQHPQRGGGLGSITTVTNPYARPFLLAIMDPRAAEPHTLVALRAASRMVQSGTLLTAFSVSAAELCVGILACKFEQTDAAIDEAVEMAIADVLQLIVCLTEASIDVNNRLPLAMFMDAFNTVFVTRHTFVHSPALACHFEDVLTQMVVTAFGQPSTLNNATQVLLFSFLVNPLLHPLLVGGGDVGTVLRWMKAHGKLV